MINLWLTCFNKTSNILDDIMFMTMFYDKLDIFKYLLEIYGLHFGDYLKLAEDCKATKCKNLIDQSNNQIEIDLDIQKIF